MLAVGRHFGWSCLPSAYMNKPLFVLDVDIVGQNVQVIESEDIVDVEPDDTIDESSVAGSADAHNDAELLNSGTSHSVAFSPSEMAAEDKTGAERSISGDAQSAAVDGTAVFADDAQSLSKRQSRVRQALATVSSYSYSITDVNLLSTLHVQTNQLISLCKQHLVKSGCSIKMRNRRRLGKKNLQCSRLNKLLTRAKARKKARRLRKKQKKVQNSKCWACYIIHCIINIYQSICLSVCRTNYNF